MWKRLIKRLLVFVTVVLVVVVAVSVWVAHQTKQVPEFYEQAIQLPPPEKLAESSEQLEASVMQLQTAAKQKGRWSATFDAQQINAWLAEQLPKRFPQLKRKGLEDPRIMIEDGVLMAAARLKDKRLDTVVSCELEVELTDQPNQLAVLVKRLRAGALPLPLSQFESRIERELARSKFPLQWTEIDETPAALVDVPSEYPGQLKGRLTIDSLELKKGELTVSGQTSEEPSEPAKPNRTSPPNPKT